MEFSQYEVSHRSLRKSYRPRTHTFVVSSQISLVTLFSVTHEKQRGCKFLRVVVGDDADEPWIHYPLAIVGGTPVL
jgi:hypothetical protein